MNGFINISFMFSKSDGGIKKYFPGYKIIFLSDFFALSFKINFTVTGKSNSFFIPSLLLKVTNFLELFESINIKNTIIFYKNFYST